MNNQGVTIDVLIERRFTNLVKKAAASGTSPA
jgi:paraquat-inducible protein B